MKRTHICCSSKSSRLIVWMIVLAMAGCHSPVASQLDDAASKLPTQVEGTSDARAIALQASLVQSGAKVITMGQDYLISIPSSLLFPDQSPQLTWASYHLLNDVVCYLQQFRKISININVFSVKYVSRQREHALTLARGRAVADYLWSQGIDSRFIFTRGLGSDKPIGAFVKKGSESPNSRVEITFRNAVA